MSRASLYGRRPNPGRKTRTGQDRVELAQKLAGPGGRVSKGLAKSLDESLGRRRVRKLLKANFSFPAIERWLNVYGSNRTTLKHLMDVVSPKFPMTFYNILGWERFKMVVKHVGGL